MNIIKYLSVLLMFVVTSIGYTQDSLFDNGGPPAVTHPVSKATKPVTLEVYPSTDEVEYRASALDITKSTGRILLNGIVEDGVSKTAKATGVVVNGPNGPVIISCKHTFRNMIHSTGLKYNGQDGYLLGLSTDEDLGVMGVPNLEPGVDIDYTDPSVGDEVTSVGCDGGNDPITSNQHTIKFVFQDHLYTTGGAIHGRSGAGLYKNGKLIGIYNGWVNPVPDPKTGTMPVMAGCQIYTRVSHVTPLLTPIQYYIKFYSGKYCTFCEQQHVITDATNDHRIVFEWAEDLIPDWLMKRLPAGYQLPVATWACEGGITFPLRPGINTIDGFIAMLESSKAKPFVAEGPLAMGAFKIKRREKPVGAMDIGPYVDDVFTYYEKYLPVGAKFKMDWARSGETNFNLYGGVKKPLGTLAIMCKTGVLDLGITYPEDFSEEQKLMLQDLKFSYEIHDDGSIDLDFGTIKLHGLLQIIDGKLQFIGQEQPKEFSLITIWTIVSTVHTLYVLFHPVADLVLENNVGFETYMDSSDMIVIDFSRGPKAKIISIMNFLLGVNRVELYRDRVVVKFDGTIFMNQYTFNIKR